MSELVKFRRPKGIPTDRELDEHRKKLRAQLAAADPKLLPMYEELVRLPNVEERAPMPVPASGVMENGRCDNCRASDPSLKIPHEFHGDTFVRCGLRDAYRELVEDLTRKAAREAPSPLPLSHPGSRGAPMIGASLARTGQYGRSQYVVNVVAMNAVLYGRAKRPKSTAGLHEEYGAPYAKKCAHSAKDPRCGYLVDTAGRHRKACGLSPTARKVAKELAAVTGGGPIELTHAEMHCMARRVGVISIRTIQRALKELARAGIVEYEGGGPGKRIAPFVHSSGETRVRRLAPVVALTPWMRTVAYREVPSSSRIRGVAASVRDHGADVAAGIASPRKRQSIATTPERSTSKNHNPSGVDVQKLPDWLEAYAERAKARGWY